MTTSDDQLRDLGKDLPYERPDDARREILRASLLAAANRREDTPPQRWRVVTAFGAGAVAAAAIAMLVLGRHAPAPAAVENARIESSAAAELEHTVAKTATGTDEIVRVHAGKVRVQTSDAQVDGAGAYEVAVRDDKLASVSVTAGTAKIVVSGQQAVFLAAGETWHSQLWTAEAQLTKSSDVATPPTVAPTVVTPATPVTPTPTETALPTIVATPSVPTPLITRGTKDAPPTTRPTPSLATAVEHALPKPEIPSTISTPKTDVPATGVPEPKPPAPAITAVAPKIESPSSTEQHFQAGWKLLKAGKAMEAANELEIAADGEGPIAIDARYFQAEALVKAGRKTEAEKALVGFLDHAPQSLRRGRAAVMLARLIAERGDKASARNWFQSAASDADPAVAAAAKAGLDAL